MRKVLKYVLITGLSLAIIAAGCVLFLIYLATGTVRYSVQAALLDPEALGSFPQEIISIDRTVVGGPVYEIVTYGGEDKFISASVPARYPEELTAFLLPSDKIESDDPKIAALAASIARGETDVVVIAREAASWVSDKIRYDSGLAQKIWAGEVPTQSALETLERREGTCSEYTNLFIAIMRSKGIPARFVTGKIYLGGYHAWAEIWLDGPGWVPVEVQKNRIGVSARHIKLFTGADFVDIGVPLQAINAKIKRLGRVHP